MEIKSSQAPLGWVLFHDLAYRGQSLAGVESALADAGCRVVIARLPGEDASAAEQGKLAAHDSIRAARSQTLQMLGECAQVFVLGHGTGALLALQMAEELPIRGCVLVAPTLALPTKYALFSGILSRFTPYLPHGDEPEGMPATAREQGVPMAALSTAHELALRVASDAASVRCRTRVLIPAEDAWSDPSAARRLAATVQHGRAIDLPGTHGCLWGKAGETVTKVCLRLVEREKERGSHA